jgi:hypothetical protein
MLFVLESTDRHYKATTVSHRFTGDGSRKNSTVSPNPTPRKSGKGTYDEAELCKLLLEISLLDSAYQRSTASRDDVLMDAAKRYRVDTEKLQKAVAKEFAAKRDKKTIRPKGRTAT